MSTVETYLRFAREFARGICDPYADLCEVITRTPAILAYLDTLPPPKRQPNLLLATFKYLYGVPETVAEMVRRLESDEALVRHTMLTRSTQTNEPARCATLLPVFGLIPGPLALIEVGASAGLCLLPDRYAYAYGDRRIGEAAVTFPCSASPNTPLPDHLPEVVWRRGLDLNPLDVMSPDDMAWLEALIWPGQRGRTERFRQAVEIARTDPPRIETGNLLTDLERIAHDAPADATLVVFHTTVMMYVEPLAARLDFAARIRDLGARWIMAEDPPVYPGITARAPTPPPTGRMTLALDETPLAWIQPHGQSIDWYG